MWGINPPDEIDSVPAETQHYLRPNRSYRLGRMAHTTKPPKAGAPGLAVKPRMVDFTLKTTKVSKDGAWELITNGHDWDEVSDATSCRVDHSLMMVLVIRQVDKPGDGRNSSGYELVVRAIRKVIITSAGQQFELEQGQDHILTEGNTVSWNARYTFRYVVQKFRLVRGGYASACTALALGRSIRLHRAVGLTLKS